MIHVAIAAVIFGVVPPTLVAPARVIWVDGNPGSSVSCRLATTRGWECEGPLEPSRGLVVIVGENGVAYVRLGNGDGAGVAMRAWGRVAIVTPGSVAPEDLRDVRLTPWTPVRSRFRLQSKRLTADKDTSTDVIRVTDTTFWIAGNEPDPDAFLTLEGPAIGSTRVAIAALAEGPPETPIYLPAAMPFSLAGRVQTSKGEDVNGADVELFQPLSTQTGDPAIDVASQSLIRVATTRSDQNGQFSFDRLSTGLFLVSVLHGTRGRGTAVVRSLGEPLVVRLAAPTYASGRVLRNRLPVVGARIRFIPNVDALLVSADATELAAQERSTGDDGRFAFQLPPVRSGTIQVIGPDGASMRLQVSPPSADGQVDLGDIALPDHRRLAVRLLNGESCVLFAVGPLGALGLTTMRASSSGTMQTFDLPEPGRWALDAECGGRSYNVDPLVIDVASTGPNPTIDVRIVK